MIDTELAGNPKEAERLSTLREYRILDTLPDESFDNLARLTAEICNTPIALVSLVDRERQWFKSKIGISVDETPRDVSFCAHAIENGETMVVEDALLDPRFSNNPLVLSSPDIRFYAGTPLRAYNGNYLGTLCVIDNKPRSLKKHELESLEIFAREVENHLELRRLKFQNEELIRMIAHDINNPLTVVFGTTELILESEQLSESMRKNISLVHFESIKITRMTEDLLDILKKDENHLANRPSPVELNSYFKKYINAVDFNITIRKHLLRTVINIEEGKFKIDAYLLQRVMDNLIDNAVKYSPENSEITLRATCENNKLEIQVSDKGIGVPKSEIDKIFDTYYRINKNSESKGLGIGLAFCKMALDSMGGSIYLTENPDEVGVTFTFSIPLEQQ